ncbi:metal-dependent phosphohydrolase, HD subdomain protein [Lentzea pudingi]|uniref:Metal-dependent phosphohydrolase, HD subdomain protein n=1 Tax=Lentzea pudingi TaxID=1789439 RepID=A0ABQ2IQH3_9PSEU|nr:metal-dependent phosphohydrolase, HD subdomain protein [Lentzea pudingi]
MQGVAKRTWAAQSIITAEEFDLVEAAAFAHDLGYAPGVNRTGFHALDGAVYLSGIGAPSRLCALVAHHSCAYLEAELRGMSANLAAWPDEGGIVRDILWWADMTTAPDGTTTNVHDRIDEIQKRYGSEDLVTFFALQARPELVAAVERTEERLRLAGVDYTAK